MTHTILGILSGKYEDDFEDSINDSEVPPPTDTLGQELSTSGTSISESGDEVAVSLGDISALRESLESDSIIRKNIVSMCVRDQEKKIP